VVARYFESPVFSICACMMFSPVQGDVFGCRETMAGTP